MVVKKQRNVCCRTRKREFHFYSPGVQPRCGAARVGTAVWPAAAANAAPFPGLKRSKRCQLLRISAYTFCQSSSRLYTYRATDSYIPIGRRPSIVICIQINSQSVTLSIVVALALRLSPFFVDMDFLIPLDAEFYALSPRI